ncbi:sensor histidine kinase [Myxosarcina sp. GI1(2024)]
MQNWWLQNLSEILNRDREEVFGSVLVRRNSPGNPEHLEQYSSKNRTAELRAQREWCGAIATAEQLLLSKIASQTETSSPKGLILAAPVPLFSNLALSTHYQIGIFTPNASKAAALMPSQPSSVVNDNSLINTPSTFELPLFAGDPLAEEQFCLILTDEFSLVMVLGTDKAKVAQFDFSFEPEVITEVWLTLRSRLLPNNFDRREKLDSLVEIFKPTVPDSRLVTSFTRQLLQNIPDETTFEAAKARHVESIASRRLPEVASGYSASASPQKGNKLEMELLQALTHEVRTPLTTIRTLTKLLLKRKQDFKPNVVKRLQEIERECTEQIDRMELIFRAAEFKSTSPVTKPVNLVPFPLEQVFQQNIPRWQKKAQRRNVELDFVLPQQLPRIVSDPAMLDRVLTGLMESCTRSLPTGGQIHVKVSTAGDRLKLQVLSEHNNQTNRLKSLGQLLSFQPETGCLSLNLDVTKNIFQAIGGKLTVRQRPQHGKEFTIYLPLGNSGITQDWQCAAKNA